MSGGSEYIINVVKEGVRYFTKYITNISYFDEYSEFSTEANKNKTKNTEEELSDIKKYKEDIAKKKEEIKLLEQKIDVSEKNIEKIVYSIKGDDYSGVKIIDAFLYPWDIKHKFNNPGEIKYSFSGEFFDTYSTNRASSTVHTDPFVDTRYLNNQKDIEIAKQALDSWSNIANIKFVEDNDSPNFRFLINCNDSHLLYKQQKNSGGHADCIAVNTNTKCNVVMSQPDQSYERKFQVMLHEIGHALGLDHPFKQHSILEKQGREPHYLKPASLKGDEATMDYSVMAYDYKSGIPSTPMLYDVQAIQFLYGANNEYNKDDNIYYANGERKLFTIWDGGGNDTIDTREYQGTFIRSATIDLREGPSHVSEVGESKFWIAYGANIENVIGGDGEEVIHLNDLDCTVKPGKGINDIYNGKGANTFFYQYGYDLIDCFKSNDKIILPANLINNKAELKKYITVLEPMRPIIIQKIILIKFDDNHRIRLNVDENMMNNIDDFIANNIEIECETMSSNSNNYNIDLAILGNNTICDFIENKIYII